MKKTLELDFSNKASNVSINKDVVSKIWGEGLGWSRAEAAAVLKDHDVYVKNLESVGIQTSTILSKQIASGPDGSFVIRETEQFSGRDASIVLLDATSVTALEQLVEDDVSTIAALLLSIPPRDGARYSKETPWLRVPVDVKPQNVVIDAPTKTPIVIDTFGPKLWSDGKIKPLPTKFPGKGQVLHDETKVGDVRFSVGRLNGYFIALATRWFINHHLAASIDDIDAFRFSIAEITKRIIEKIVTDNPLFNQDYAKLLVSDASEDELKSIRYGSYEGPMYVQSLYEAEQSA